MSRTTFGSLVNKLLIFNPQTLRSGNPETTLEKQLLMTIWYLANLESFRSVADRFGLSSYTPWTSFYRVCRRLLNLNRRAKIRGWPNDERCRVIQDSFERKNNFPGIVGAIDGSHILIKAPKENSASYINRKGFHSILLQGVCDHELKSIDCYVGEAGSIHDACMFRRSYLGQHSNEFNFMDGHLLGDSAYPLLERLLVPYKDNGHLTPIEINYNNINSKCRVGIEQTFALLKGRFRRLKLLENTKVNLLPLIIISACILYNICREQDNEEDLENLEAEVEEERILNINAEVNNVPNIQLALTKRNRIAHYLNEPV